MSITFYATTSAAGGPLHDGPNLANANARAVLGLLDLPMEGDLLWEAEPLDLATFRAALDVALALCATEGNAFTRPAVTQARWYDPGLDRDGLEARLIRLRTWASAMAQAGMDRLTWG